MGARAGAAAAGGEQALASVTQGDIDATLRSLPEGLLQITLSDPDARIPRSLFPPPIRGRLLTRVLGWFQAYWYYVDLNDPLPRDFDPFFTMTNLATDFERSRLLLLPEPWLGTDLTPPDYLPEWLETGREVVALAELDVQPSHPIPVLDAMTPDMRKRFRERFRGVGTARVRLSSDR